MRAPDHRRKIPGTVAQQLDMRRSWPLRRLTGMRLALLALPLTLAACADTAADPANVQAGAFSFFVTSLEAMQLHSGSESGFGGDLRFGEATGLAGADKLCTTIAEAELSGSGAKGWRAFLSATTGGDGGGAVHARDRVGAGPWYDRNGVLVATSIDGLLGERPDGDASIVDDLPNERGESQENQPGANAAGTADNHDVLTGSDQSGELDASETAATCDDWTSVAVSGRPRLGHSWPASSGQSWVTAHTAAGCAAVVNLADNGPGSRTCSGVGCGGGYGAIYCFALSP
jgi:hypothetical protein